MFEGDFRRKSVVLIDVLERNTTSCRSTSEDSENSRPERLDGCSIG